MWQNPQHTRLAVWLVGVLVLSACGGTSLHHAAPTPRALAREVLDALAAGDLPRLQALAIDKIEFRRVVWPELPAARPERNLPVEYVWDDLHAKSRAGLQHALSSVADGPFEVVNVRFAGGTTRFRSYLVHRDAVLRLRRRDGGVEELRLFGSVIERDGRFKVFSYVTD